MNLISHHHLQDTLRMTYPPHHSEWIHPFQMFQQNDLQKMTSHELDYNFFLYELEILAII